MDKASPTRTPEPVLTARREGHVRFAVAPGRILQRVGPITAVAIVWTGRTVPTSEARGEGASNMQIKRIGSQPSRKAPAEHFTGIVRIVVTVEPNEKHWHGASPT